MVTKCPQLTISWPSQCHSVKEDSETQMVWWDKHYSRSSILSIYLRHWTKEEWTLIQSMTLEELRLGTSNRHLSAAQSLIPSISMPRFIALRCLHISCTQIKLHDPTSSLSYTLTQVSLFHQTTSNINRFSRLLMVSLVHIFEIVTNLFFTCF